MKVRVRKAQGRDPKDTEVILTMNPQEVESVLQGGSLSERAQDAIVEALREHLNAGRAATHRLVAP